MKNTSATIIVIAVLAAVPALVWMYEGLYRPLQYEGRVINITGVGARGAWTLDDVNGLNYWWKPFEPATIHMQLGERVVLRFLSADVFHQFYAPALGLGPVDVEPGKIVEIGFNAEKTGVFQYYCTSMCGGCHFYMQGWIVITPEGETPVSPTPITCILCLPAFDRSTESNPILQGEYLYQAKGCVTCHGVAGAGGVKNYNYIKDTVPAHNQTAAKLFLTDDEDLQTFLNLMVQGVDVGNPAELPDIARARLVAARFHAAVDIINYGKSAARLDMTGPDPPLQMPAWQSTLNRRQIHDILAYFLSLSQSQKEK